MTERCEPYDSMPSPHLLRPHHGMCLAYFVGMGYSGSFTQNMARMKALLESGADIQLTVGPDEICAACPNLHRDIGSCRGEEKVLRYDQAVLSALSLSEGVLLPYDELSRMVHTHILNLGCRENIYGDCQWSALCH